MDIVSRLKKFMEQGDIAISQFADTCRIPRPTMSQILNGRNKKISDELISKIHLAYPELSVLWLMFGEGDMMTNANIRISEPKSGSETAPTPRQEPEEDGHTLFSQPTASCHVNPAEKQSEIKSEPFNDYFIKTDEFIKPQQEQPATATINFMSDDAKNRHNAELATMGITNETGATAQQSPQAGDSNISDDQNRITGEILPDDIDQQYCAADAPTPQNITLPTSPNKRITSIVVFYSDNSFQSFSPTP